MKRQWFVLFLVGIFLILTSSAATSGSRARPEMVDTLERIDIAARSITLGGHTYHLAKEVRWVGFGDHVSASSVLPRMIGRRMGLVFEGADEEAVVTQVWLQP